MGIEVSITGSGNTAVAIPGPAYTQYSQSFPSGAGFDLVSVSLKLALGAGSPGNVYCNIYAVDGNDLPVGGSLGTSAPVAAASLNTHPTWSFKLFTFSSVVTLSASTQYCFVISVDTGSWNTNYIYIGTNGSDTYGSGVMGRYDAPDWSDKNDTYPATIRSPDAATKAENPSPANGATEVDFSGFELSWDDGGGADTFDVYIGLSGALTQVASTQAGTTYTTSLAELESVFSAAPIEQVIYWRIDAINDAGTTTGDEWNFDARPAKPITPAPIDTSTDQLLGLGTVSWIDGGNADTYDVYFGLQGNPILQSSGQIGVFWPIGDPLLYNNTYEWNINAINIFGTTTGDTWTFSDIVFFPPLPSGVTLTGNSGPNGEGTPTGTPTGFNNTITVKRLVAVAENRFWIEDI